MIIKLLSFAPDTITIEGVYRVTNNWDGEIVIWGKPYDVYSEKEGTHKKEPFFTIKIKDWAFVDILPDGEG